MSTTSPETLLEVTTNANTSGNGNKVSAAKSFKNQDRLHKKHAVDEAIESNIRRSIGNNVAAVAPFSGHLLIEYDDRNMPLANANTCGNKNKLFADEAYKNDNHLHTKQPTDEAIQSMAGLPLGSNTVTGHLPTEYDVRNMPKKSQKISLCTFSNIGRTTTNNNALANVKDYGKNINSLSRGTYTNKGQPHKHEFVNEPVGTNSGLRTRNNKSEVALSTDMDIIDPYNLQTCDILEVINDNNCQQQQQPSKNINDSYYGNSHVLQQPNYARKHRQPFRRPEAKSHNVQHNHLQHQPRIKRRIPAEYIHLGQCTCVCCHCEAMFWECKKVASTSYTSQTGYNKCCYGGRIILRPPPEYPQYVKELYGNAHFMDNIRAMTSVGANVDKSINKGKGPYVYRISGQIYHWIGSMCPDEGQPPSPRYMYAHYLDALAICRVHGSPSFFITFTCNAKWLEIEEYMKPFPLLTTADRADIIDRIFERKVRDYINFFRNSNTFGDVTGVLYTIEFQKCDLPHCHSLLWINAASRVQQDVNVDKYVCAELPNPISDANTYAVISELMIHGPCRYANPSAACMKDDGRCNRNFPKSYCDKTYIDKDGFVHYRRRDTKIQTQRQNVWLDNRYVVPYNITLCMRYYAHINVEYCGWTMLIKYLFKYISKGTDRVIANITRPLPTAPSASNTPTIQIDEIKNYIEARYIGPHEACWRILDFPIHYRNPPVQTLAVNLENMQQLTFRSKENLQSINFSTWLLHIGDGTICDPDETDDEDTFTVQMPTELCIPDSDTTLATLISFIYDQKTLQTPTPTDLQKKAIVCPKNKNADMINAQVLSLVNSQQHVYLSLDEAMPHGNDGGETELLYPLEYLNSLNFANFPPHRLELKAIIDDGTATAVVTCFSPEAHTFVPDCNTIVNTIEDKDNNHVSPVLKQAEGHIYIFRLRFGQKARPGYPNFTLDAVLKPVTTPVLALPPPEPVKSPAAEIVEGPSIASDPTTTDEGISQYTQTDVQTKSRIPEEKTKKTRHELFQDTDTHGKKPKYND
nr:DNA helicase [Tanacetum cinerariifolium]